MKKNLLLMLSLSVIVLLAGCGDQNVVDSDIDDTMGDNVVVTDENDQDFEGEALNPQHPEWVSTSLTLEDLERIEDTMPPLSYNYETYDMKAETEIDSGSFTATEEDKSLSIPEYKTMISREVISSGIEDDMIYTLTDITLEDGTILHVLYVNEPDTLFCRAISVQNGDLTTLYSNFVYAADVQ